MNQTETFSIWKVSIFSVWFILAWLVQSSNKGWSALLPTCGGYRYGSWVKQFIFVPWDTNRCITCGALKYGRVGVDDILSGVMTVRKFGEPGRARQFSNIHQTGQNGIWPWLFIGSSFCPLGWAARLNKKGKAPAWFNIFLHNYTFESYSHFTICTPIYLDLH
jgi:hypothetical protein